MKKIRYTILLVVTLVITTISCKEDFPYPDLNDHVGAITLLQIDPVKNFFNLLNDLDTEEVVFTLNVDGFGITKVASVDVVLTYTEKNRVYDPFRMVFRDSVYAPKVISTITTFPQTITVTGQQLAEVLEKTTDDFELGDKFTLSFPIKASDGRVFTTALDSELCNEPVQPSSGGCKVEWSISCPSAIPTGTWDTNVVNPGGGFYTVEITSTGAGQYTIANFNLDYDNAFYGSFTQLTLLATFSDVCNTITLNGNAFANVKWRGTGIYDPVAKTITFPTINDVHYARGPWNNGGAGYILTKQ